MNSHALASLERYGAFRAAATAAPEVRGLGDGIAAEDIGTAAVDRTCRGWIGHGTHPIPVCSGAGVLLGGDLVHRVLLDAFTDAATSPPKSIRVELLRRAPPVARPAPSGSTLAKSAVEEIEALTGLTNQSIASLVGVSRRGLQKWLSGKPISQPREQHLFDLLAAVRALDAGDPDATRRRLMDRAPGRVRVFDLLAAGRFDTAVDMATGRRRALPPLPEKPESEGVVAQLNRLEGRVDFEEAPPTGRFSGRLRR